MSLILDALKKAKDLGGRTPPPAPPAALASFRFGRPSRSEKIKRLTLIAGLLLVIISSVGYTANFWIKRLRRPRAVLIQAPRPPLPADSLPAEEAPIVQDASKQTAPEESSKAQPVQSGTTTNPAQIANVTSPSVPVPVAAPGRPLAKVVRRRSRKSPAPVSDPPSAREFNQPVQIAGAIIPDKAVTAAALSSTGAPPTAEPPSPPAGPPAARTDITQPSRDPFEVAVFYQKSGDYLKALEQYNKVLAADPLNASVYNNLGLLYYATNNITESVRAFRRAILIDPKYDKAHNNLGLALLRQPGQDAEAEREFERALQLNTKNAEALTNLAALAKKSGNTERAKVQYLQAIQANPASAEAHYNLAVLYEEQGEAGNAVDHFKKFLTLGSGSHPEVVADVEQKIKELSKK
jgi:Tfp pilus assembly protein PilF